MDIRYPVLEGDGDFIDGGPNNLGTIVSALHLNTNKTNAKSITLELNTILEAAGITADPTKYDQLLMALNKNYGNSINTLKRWVDVANPVGMLADSFDSKPYNEYWLNLNGDLYAHKDYPLLYDFYLMLGYLPNSQNLMALLDARALVKRAQNKGRFATVEEFGLGQYQEDAMQSHEHYYRSPQEGIDIDRGIGSAPSNWSIDDTQIYKSSAQIGRLALETRVKAIGVTALQHVGFDFEKELLKELLNGQ